MKEAAAVVAYLKTYWYADDWLPLWTTSHRQDFTMLGLNTTAHVEGLFGLIKVWLVRALRGVDGLRLIETLQGLPGSTTPSLVTRKQIALDAAMQGVGPRGRTRTATAQLWYLLSRARLLKAVPACVTRIGNTQGFSFMPTRACLSARIASTAAADADAEEDDDGDDDEEAPPMRTTLRARECRPRRT